jgi:hypothetical protein
MHLVNSYFWFAVAGLMAVFIRIELAEPGRGDAGRGRPPQAAAHKAGLEDAEKALTGYLVAMNT